MKIVDFLTFGRKPAVVEDSGKARVGGFREYNPDSLVGRKGLEVYDNMLTDPQIQAVVTIKKSSILSRGYKLQTAVGGRQEVTDFCSWVLEDMHGSVVDVLAKVLDALVKGYSICGLRFKVLTSGKYAGKLGIESIKSKDPSNYQFEVDEYMNLTGIYSNLDAKSFPLDRFVVFTYEGRYENPYGTSDLRAAYRNWWCKDFLVRFWNLYLEKFGAPTVKGVFRRGTPQTQQDALLTVLKSIQKNSAIVLPEDMTAELLETIKQGDTGFHDAIAWHDKQIAKAVLGQTLVTDEGTKIGSFALAKVHLDVLRMCLRGLKRQLEETVAREQILRRLVVLNYGPDEIVPLFSLGPLEERDMAVVTDVAVKLCNAGIVRADDPMWKEYLGIEPQMPAPVPDQVILPVGAQPEVRKQDIAITQKGVSKPDQSPTATRADGGKVNVG